MTPPVPDRLLLFDIDGTLLSSGRGGLLAFVTALTEVFGTAGDVETYRFEGKLDPLIVTELMRGAGFDEAVIEQRRKDALQRYLELLEIHLAATAPILKPGVRELVETVAASPRATVALLTGNVQRGARIKLGSAGLWHHFPFGAFGDDGPRRVDLGPVALERASAHTGRAYSGHECVVIGDARADVECGQAIGARVVAVATGRTSRDELLAAGADVALSDFSDLSRSLEAIYGRS
jgi:phosphoglycolate phosphatase-like HAD superfamily hydrolase